jgi:EAL domain-containing protein (putative c-di-GMP-specific phosphodiesterase class I)
MLTRLLAAAAESVDDHGTLLQVSASLGVTVFPQLEGVEADQLLRQSDQAMYQAKLSGKNRYHIFDAEHDRSLRGHHEGLERVRTALIKDEFVLYYQPKVNMRTGTVIGAEALIRWQHPVRGLLAPAAFLPLVADHPLSITLGEWVLNSAMAQVEAWKTEGLQMPVSVNIDANHLQSPDFVTQLRQLLEHHPGVARGDLELEVLETSALEDMGHVAAVILACKDMGVGFALDDFGTGYSSLTYLKRLPAGLLKIDQSFVRDMMDDPDDLAILEGVLGLARAFRCQAIAEGVESVANGQMLLRLGCELAQGYAIARPMPAAAMPGWLATWKTDASWLNQAQVRLDDRHILFASVEHRAWIAQVARYVHGEPNCTAVPSHQPCRFSEWLEQNRHLLQAAYATLPAVELLLAVVHTRANDLMRLKEQGHATEAIARLGDLYALRDQLFEQLQAMLD